MGILVVGGVLFGIILGQFFKSFVLIPAGGLAIVLVLINPAHMENSLLGWFIQFVVLTTRPSKSATSLDWSRATSAVHPSVRRNPASANSTRPCQVALRPVRVAEETPKPTPVNSLLFALHDVF